MNKKYLLLFIFLNSILAQKIIYSYPHKVLLNDDLSKSSSLRPYVQNAKKGFSVNYNSQYSYSSSPNLDNYGNKFSLNGNNSFASLRIEYVGKNLLFLLEPYSLTKDNRSNKIFFRGGRYTFTNEVSNLQSKPYSDLGIRESMFFLHHNFFGIGISNLNQWIGPGIHNSLTMSSNTKGFNHLFIGSLKEKSITKSISYESRYTFSKISDREGGVFLTNLVLAFSLNSDIRYKFGIVRDFLSGGKKSANGKSISQEDAMQLVFGPLFSDSKRSLDYTTNWGFEPWDQVLTGFFEFYPNKNTSFYIELGTGDHRKNFSDLLAHWDHNLAYIIGFRSNPLINTAIQKKLLIGLEYTSLTGSSNTRKFRASGPWFDNWWYDYNSYEGRRWSAHSGSDSDDLSFHLGIKNPNNSIIVFIAQERKGLILEEYPELKKEYSIQLSKKINNSINLFTYIEREDHINYCFINGEYKSDYCISMSFEYSIR